jgi:hypothetical protein
MLFDKKNRSKKIFLKSIQNNDFWGGVELIPVYSKVLYSKNDVIIYKLGARFLRSYQDVKLFVNKFDH